MKLFSKQNNANKLGFIEDQQGIISRYLREKSNWDIHLQNSKQFILDTCNAEAYNSIAILGSGWLLDVPIDDIVRRFEKIYLVDIYHPKQVKYKLRNHKNIEYLTCDITGGLIDIVADVLRKKQEPNLPEITIPHFQMPVSADFVVSLNLLNQLDILLVDNVTERYSYTKAELIEFRKSIQQAHIAFLENHSFAGIFDFKEYVYSQDNILESERSTIYAQLPACNITKEWQWKFDSSGMYYEHKTVLFDVKAISNSMCYSS